MMQLEITLKRKKAYKKTIIFLSASSEALINLGNCETITFCNNLLCPFPASDSTTAQFCSTQGHPRGLK